MFDVVVEPHANLPVAKRAVEYVERKGTGHPDSICDAVMESISVALSRAYLDVAGRVLHHNVDKGLLVAGQTAPRLGGGTVQAPMRLVVGDRATAVVDGARLPIPEIVATAAREWFKSQLRFVDPDQHLVLQNELRPGSAELVGLFDRGVGRNATVTPGYGANDTSAAVGFAPLSETEQLVMATERFLNSPDFKQRHPETGEDVKVMGIRRGRELHLTVAIALVDRFIDRSAAYFRQTEAVEFELRKYLLPQLKTLDDIRLRINALDDPDRGVDGMYLTVLGTSAEGADGGQVGRGNRASGLITFCRPMSLEAVAGKNPVSHVGKIYSLLSQQIARRVFESTDALEEVYIWLCSQIGSPVDAPWFASAQVALVPGATIRDVQDLIAQICHEELRGVGSFSDRLARGELPVC